MSRKITETTDENVDTEEETSFDDLDIPVNYSDYDILEEEEETIYKNDEVCIKTKEKIRRGNILLVTQNKKRGQ